MKLAKHVKFVGEKKNHTSFGGKPVETKPHGTPGTKMGM
jgi:hypothetical protein